MGQKVNPIGFRILNNKVWQSVWYDKKNYAKKLINDIKIRKDFVIAAASSDGTISLWTLYKTC